jgi:hypothetical protein
MLNEMETFDEDGCNIPDNCDVDKLNFDLDVWGNIAVLAGLVIIQHAISIYTTLRLARKIRA